MCFPQRESDVFLQRFCGPRTDEEEEEDMSGEEFGNVSRPSVFSSCRKERLGVRGGDDVEVARKRYWGKRFVSL